MHGSNVQVPGWRQHRVTLIVYVFERDKDRFLRVLHENARAAG